MSEIQKKSSRLAYLKSDDVVLIRRRHRIGFIIGTSAAELIEILKRVPPNSRVDEVIEDINGDNITTVEFHEEIVTKKA